MTAGFAEYNALMKSTKLASLAVVLGFAMFASTFARAQGTDAKPGDNASPATTPKQGDNPKPGDNPREGNPKQGDNAKPTDNSPGATPKQDGSPTPADKSEKGNETTQASARKPFTLRVSSGVAEGLKIHDVRPKYPHEALVKGIQGEVSLRATIDKKGDLVDLEVVGGDSILAEAAIKAIKKWKYRPYVFKGEPVEVETLIRVDFHLNR